MADRPLRLATRGSKLARAQAGEVASRLQARWPALDVAIQVVATAPPARLDAVKGSFTADIQRAVLEGRADVAVHSAKDLPAVQVDGVVIAAVPPREDPRDVLVGAAGPVALTGLPAGARVGSSSPRRVALLRHLRPDVDVVGLRGNVDTRLDKIRAGEADAAVLAAAGLRRLGLFALAEGVLDPRSFVPAPGQGCLAVEAGADDARTIELLRAIDDAPSAAALRGERAFLARLGGACTLPAGAWLDLSDDHAEMTGFVAALDGSGLVRERVGGAAQDPERLGVTLAERLLAAAGPEVHAALTTLTP